MVATTGSGGTGRGSRGGPRIGPRARSRRRLLVLVLLAFAVAGVGLASAPGHARHAWQYEADAAAFLAGIGIAPGEARIGLVEIREGEIVLSEYALVWIRLDRCPGDWLVLEIASTGAIQHAYMRRGCPVPGVNR